MPSTPYTTSPQANVQEENVILGENFEKTNETGNRKERVEFASYEEYKKFVRKGLARRICHRPTRGWVRDNAQKLLSVWMLDLMPVQEVLRSLYSGSHVGSPPYDPQILLRSLLLMAEFGFNSIKKWVRELRSRPVLALFTGTSCEKIPAASTHYDFLQRLENGPYKRRCQHDVKSSDVRHAKNRKTYDFEERPDDEVEPEHDVEDRKGIIRRFVTETIALEKEPEPRDLTARLNEMLLELGVKVSVKKGIIKDITHLTLCGDGTSIESAGSYDGKRICSCKQEGKHRCKCPRKFSDPDAQWGWRTRPRGYFYGYRMFQLVCPSEHHNLPISITLSGAKRHEVLQAVECISRLRKSWPEANIERTAFDALFDMYPFYEYLQHCGSAYAIPYKQDPPESVVLGCDKTRCNSQGIPLCKLGYPMLYHSTDKEDRHVYRCPIKRGSHRDGRYTYIVHGNECELKKLCEDMPSLGPYIRLSTHDDLRIHPTIHRESSEYNELLKLRTSCERSNSMKKEYYKARDLNTRVMSYAFIRLTLISILEHSRILAIQRLEHASLDTGRDLMGLFT